MDTADSGPTATLLSSTTSSALSFNLSEETITHIREASCGRDIKFLTELQLHSLKITEEEFQASDENNGIFQQLLQLHREKTKVREKSNSVDSQLNHVIKDLEDIRNSDKNSIITVWKTPIFANINEKKIAFFLLHANISTLQQVDLSHIDSAILGFALFVSKNVCLSEDIAFWQNVNEHIRQFQSVIQLCNDDVESSVSIPGNQLSSTNFIFVKHDKSNKNMNEEDESPSNATTLVAGNPHFLDNNQLVSLFNPHQDDRETLDNPLTAFVESTSLTSILSTTMDYFTKCMSQQNSHEQLFNNSSNAKQLLELLSKEHKNELKSIMSQSLFSTEEEKQSNHKSLHDKILSKFQTNLNHGTPKHLTSARDELIFQMKSRFDELFALQREKRENVEEVMKSILIEFEELMKNRITDVFCQPQKYAQDGKVYGQNAVSKFKKAMTLCHGVELAVAVHEIEKRVNELKEKILMDNTTQFEMIDLEISEAIASSVESYQEELSAIGNGVQLCQYEVDEQIKEMNDDVKQRFLTINTTGPEKFISAKTSLLEDKMNHAFMSWFAEHKRQDDIRSDEHKIAQEALVQELEDEVKTYCTGLKLVNDIYLKQQSIVDDILERYRELMMHKVSPDKYTELATTLTLSLKKAFVSSAQKTIDQRKVDNEIFMAAVEKAVGFYQNLMNELSEDDPILDDGYLPSNHKPIKENSLLAMYQDIQHLGNDHPSAEEYIAQADYKIEAEYLKISEKTAKNVSIFKKKTDIEIQDQTESYQNRMMNQLGKLESMNDLKQLDRKESNIIVAKLKYTNHSLSIRLTEFKLDGLKQSLTASFVDISSGFALVLSTRDQETNSAIVKSRELFESEMKTHTRNKKFSHPSDLQSFNQHVQKLISTRNSNWNKFLPYQVKQIKTALDLTFQSHQKQFIMELAKDPAIGIDLGTTYTCVSVFHKKKIALIPNPQGNPLIPSYVKYNTDGQAEKIGIDAKDDAYVNAENTVFEAKRIIGRKYDNPQLTKSISLWPFNVVNKSGIPKIAIGTKFINPEEVSAEILQEMKRMAEHHLGTTVTKAVITVPAKFNDGQRQATIDAGKCAGLDVIGLLSEPVAAAYAFQMDKFEIPQRHVLIYDLGGGTFDVALLKICSGQIETLAVDGDTHLGGGDIDHNMVNYCVDEFKKKTGVDLTQGKDSINSLERDNCRRILNRLLITCESKKRALSAFTCNTVEIIIPAICTHDSTILDLNVVLTRETFNEINGTLFQKTINTVKQCLDSVGLSKEKVDDIVLVGGSTYVLKIREMLSEFFNGKALNYSVNPDEAVSYGAAIHAAVLNGQMTEEDLLYKTIQDITPTAIGIELVDLSLSVIIPKFTKIPLTTIKKDYTTTRDNQTSVVIKTFQGDHAFAARNDFLGEFTLSGIPPAPRGHEKIDVSMKVNAEGVLHVTAVCRSSGSKNAGTLTIKTDKRRLTKDQITEISSRIGKRVGAPEGRDR